MRARPNYADAFTGMGISLKELKRREEAEACFQQVVRLRPGCSLSLGNLAGEHSYLHVEEQNDMLLRGITSCFAICFSQGADCQTKLSSSGDQRKKLYNMI